MRPKDAFLLVLVAGALTSAPARASPPPHAAPSPPSPPTAPYLSPLPQGAPYVLPTDELPTPGLAPMGDVATGQGLSQPALTPVDALATPAGGVFQCERPYVWIANEPAGLVTGNCRRGEVFTRTFKSDPVAPFSSYFDGGHLAGDHRGCGWVRFNYDRKVGEGSATACGTSASRPRSSFTSAVNCAPGTCSDGSPVDVVSRCHEYANVRPFSTFTGPVGGPANYLRYRDSGRLRWRYVTKYNDYVLVRDEAVPEGEGNWVFVSRSCLRL